MATENIYVDMDDKITLKVHDETFQVSRRGLREKSSFFREMLDQPNAQDCIELEAVTVEGAKWCIKYIEAGDYMVAFTPAQSDEEDIKIVESIAEVVEAAAVMKLEGFIKDCLSFLNKNLKVKSCLSAVELLLKFGEPNEIQLGQKFVSDNMTQIIESDQFRFMKGEDLTSYLQISNLDEKTHWQAIITWSKTTTNEKEPHVKKSILAFLKIKDGTLSEQVDESWNLAVQDSNSDVIEGFTKVFRSSVKQIDEGTSIETAFRILEILRHYEDDNEHDKLKVAVLHHIAHNIKEALSSNQFDQLSFDSVCTIFTSESLACSDELTKWNALIQWVKVDQKRESHLFDMINFIDFDKVSDEDQSKIMANLLIQKLPRCKTKIKRIISVKTDHGYDFAKDDKEAADKHERPTQKDKTLIVFDQGTGLLTAVDHDLGKHSVVAKAEIVPNSQIASLDGNIILYQSQHIYELKKSGGWKDLGMVGHGENTWSRIVEFKNDIYLVSRKTTAKYSPADGSITKAMPGCGLGDGFTVSSSSQRIFAYGGRLTAGEAKEFLTEWVAIKRMPVMGRFFGAATQGGAQYLLGGRLMKINSSIVYRFENKQWTKREQMKNRRSKFGATFYNNKLYVVGGTGKKAESIEMYTPHLDKWETVGDVKGVKGEVMLCVCDTLNITIK